MKYMLMFIDGGGGMPDTPEGRAVRTLIDQWFGKLAQDGRLQSAEELQPARTATTIRFAGARAMVTDGPFVESKETVGGFAVIEAADLDEAVEVAKGWPGGGPVEVRPCAGRSTPG